MRMTRHLVRAMVAAAFLVGGIATAYDGRVRVGKCDVDDNQTSAMKFDIRSLPTLLMFRDGKVVAQMVGPATRSKIEAWVTSALG